jgi:uncharacterized protein
MIERLLTLGPRGRLMMFVLLVLVSAAAIWQLRHLQIDRGDERLIGESDPGWPALRQAQRDFGAGQSVMVYLRAKNLWTTEVLSALQKVTFDLEDSPVITSVKSLLSATNIRDKGDFVDAGPLVDIVPQTAEGLAEIRDDALYSPTIRRNFISDDGQATAITIGYAAKPGDPNHELAIYHLIETKIAPLRQHFDVVFQLGWPRLNAEIDQGLVADLKILVPLSILILVATVTIFLRTPSAIPIPLVTGGITILWTLGFMATAGIPITLLTAILPALIIVVGSVEDVHLMASYLDGLKTGDPHPRHQAIAHMARHVGAAIVITSAATVLGFASNIVTDIPLIREFSIAAAFAMLANFVVTVCAMPLMLHAFGAKVNRLASTDEVPRGIIGVVVRLVEFLSGRFERIVVAAVAVLVIGFGSQIGHLKVNNDPMAYFRAGHPFVVDAEQVHTDLAGLQNFSVTLRAAQPGWYKTVDGLRMIAEVQALLNNQTLYDSTVSLADLMALMHQEMHRGDKRYHRVPSAQADFDLYLSMMPRSELKSFVTEDYSVAQITVRHNVADSVKLNAAIDHLTTVLPTVLGTNASFAVTGKNLMVNRAAESLIDGELLSLALILIVIFALFSFLYTSWLAGLLALIPNLIPIILNFGVMSYLGVPLNPGTAMVAAIAIGLAVDDTIHLMTRFGNESRRLVDEHAAVRATIRGEAVPVLTTTVALALGFAIFSLSNFRIVAEFGLLAAGTMVYAAISDLLLMPILLKHLRLATVWDIVALKVDSAVLTRCPLFLQMSSYQIKKLILLSEIVEFAQDDALLTQGEVSSGMYVLLSGSVDVLIENNGSQLTIDHGHAGDIFGEVGFAATGVSRTATIKATTSVTAVRLDASRAQKGLRFYPGIAARLFRNISAVLGARLMHSHQLLLRTADLK